MDCRIYLREIGRMRRELNLLMARREELTGAAGVSGIRYDKDRVQTSPGNTFESALINMLDKTGADDRRVRYLRTEIDRRTKQIKGIGGKTGAVLYCRYVAELSWAQTCHRLDVSYDTAMRLHARGLAKFRRMWPMSG